MVPSGDDRFLTRGQAPSIDAIASMLRVGVPHALLLVGPSSVGKTTLARDLAAGLLCQAPDTDSRPCRACRGCRLVAAGNHPDLHRLAPEGAGRQIGIGDARHPEPGTVRRLASELALLPVEGGARVAIVEEAERLNEDAQNALLKTLEEPPSATTIVLCTADEDRLLPTVRSRCARLRLGTVGPRDIEVLLEQRGAADPTTAARLARVAGGRPGLALAYALAPEAIVARGEISRVLVDLLSAGRTGRLEGVRALLGTAAQLSTSLERSSEIAPAVVVASASRHGSRRSQAARARSAASALTDPASSPAGSAVSPEDGSSAADDDRAAALTDPLEAAAPERAPTAEGSSGGRASAPERRRAALALLDAWRDVARDLTVVARGGRSRIRDAGLLEEIEPIAARIDDSECAEFLERLEQTARLVEGNANPELALDVLVLRWPHVPA